MIAATRKRLPQPRELRMMAEMFVRAEAIAEITSVLPADWMGWHSAIFGETGAPFAPHHKELWEWAWSIERGVSIAPFVGIWARGGAKSTNAERIVTMLGARQKRNYAVYVCATQSQADDHVDSIAAMLESPAIQRQYPDLGTRKIGKYGASKGWKRSRLRTNSGFTIDAYGLDTAMRGKRIEDYRPDFIILDDVDEGTDTEAITARKLNTIRKDIIPAGSTDRIVLFIQNLMFEDSIAAQITDGRAKMLAGRIVSGPHKAIKDLETEQETLPDGTFRDVITGGRATWEGQGLAECQSLIDLIGLDAFLVESQHEVQIPLGGLFEGVTYRHCDAANVPDLVDVVVTVDPAVTSTDRSDSHGLSVGGIDDAGVVYVLHSWEQISTPEASLRLALKLGIQFKASRVIVETDQGGDLWEESYNRIVEELIAKVGEEHRIRIPGFGSEKAGAIGSKIHRANLMLAAYKQGKIVHVRNADRTHELLERALRRFPKRKPFDLVDSQFWLWHTLADGAGMPGFW